MQVRLLFVPLLVLLFAYCNNKSSQTATSPAPTPIDSKADETAPAAPADSIDLTKAEPDPVIVTDTTSATAGDPAKLVSDSLALDHEELKFNPPHGEPGHRCDVAVGAIMGPPTGVNLCK